MLVERVIQEPSSPYRQYGARNSAVELLVDRWPDDATHSFLVGRAREDGFIAAVLAEQHSNFGKIVFTRDLDGIEPYLDPVDHISRERIEQAAKKAQVPTEEIDKVVRSLSIHMGWDIFEGIDTWNDVGSSR